LIANLRVRIVEHSPLGCGDDVLGDEDLVRVRCAYEFGFDVGAAPGVPATPSWSGIKALFR
jgi:hypothetical protein